MDNNTEKLINDLARKLGTTTEYLWSVLIKQAPVSATIQLFQTLAVILFGYILYRVHKRLAKKDEDGDTGYEMYDAAAPVMIVASAIFSILFLVVFCCFSSVVNGYFNPEYWALKRVLETLGK